MKANGREKKREWMGEWKPSDTAINDSSYPSYGALSAPAHAAHLSRKPMFSRPPTTKSFKEQTEDPSLSIQPQSLIVITHTAYYEGEKPQLFIHIQQYTQTRGDRPKLQSVVIHPPQTGLEPANPRLFLYQPSHFSR